jgi:hypothetical protein
LEERKKAEESQCFHEWLILDYACQTKYEHRLPPHLGPLPRSGGEEITMRAPLKFDLLSTVAGER